jgi:hypothetical protein
MNKYVASDPVVQRFRTPEEFGQGFSRRENRRSRERQRGHVAQDPRVKRFIPLGDLRREDSISVESWSHKVMRTVDLWIYVGSCGLLD